LNEMIDATRRRDSALRAGLAVLLCLVAGAAAPTAEAAENGIVSCYDAGRDIVTHTLPDRCRGEIISSAREAALDAARRRQIRSTIEAEDDDPLTGQRRLIGTGTGFYIGRDGALLTNDHVINHCGMITATPDDGDKVALKLVATDPRRDIALLRADVPPHAVATFSAAPASSDGARLAVVGYPAYGLPTRLSTLSPAHVDPIRLATASDRVEFHGEVRHGNSGSPLLDDAGNVLGIVHATIDTPKVFRATGKRIVDIGVAVSWSAVMRFLAIHSVKPILASSDQPVLDPEALHAKSRRFVAQIGCWR
jgi:S1-C subfamily serine protease